MPVPPRLQVLYLPGSNFKQLDVIFEIYISNSNKMTPLTDRPIVMFSDAEAPLIRKQESCP